MYDICGNARIFSNQSTVYVRPAIWINFHAFFRTVPLFFVDFIFVSFYEILLKKLQTFRTNFSVLNQTFLIRLYGETPISFPEWTNYPRIFVDRIHVEMILLFSFDEISLKKTDDFEMLSFSNCWFFRNVYTRLTAFRWTS